MGNNAPIYEAFTASFTGQLSRVGLGNGKVYTFATPFRVHKDVTYMIKYDTTSHRATLLTVVAP